MRYIAIYAHVDPHHSCLTNHWSYPSKGPLSPPAWPKATRHLRSHFDEKPGRTVPLRVFVSFRIFCGKPNRSQSKLSPFKRFIMEYTIVYRYTMLYPYLRDDVMIIWKYQSSVEDPLILWFSVPGISWIVVQIIFRIPFTILTGKIKKTWARQADKI